MNEIAHEQLEDSQETLENTIVEDEFQDEEVVSKYPIPYSYAKKHNVLVAINDDGDAELICAVTPKVVVLSELKRRLSRKLVLKKIPSAEFDQQLREAYDSSDNQANQLMDDIGDGFDLTRLADEVPEATDLLEADDDAPVILSLIHI